ncbi:hypothetical protein Tco_0902257 [Tanacetum coccineum]
MQPQHQSRLTSKSNEKKNKKTNLPSIEDSSSGTNPQQVINNESLKKDVPKHDIKSMTRSESRDAIFDENRLSLIPRPKDVIPNSVESQRDDHSDDVPSELPEPRKGDFQLYLVEGSRDL